MPHLKENPHAFLPEGRLDIAVIGMGGIGTTLGFQLAHAGKHNITAIARPNSLRLIQLQAAGGILRSDGQRADVNVMAMLDEEHEYNLVIVTMPAHRLANLVPALQRSKARRFLFMLNQFDPESLQVAIGSERCNFGMPFLQATINKTGKLEATIGAGGQKSKLDDPALVKVFNAAGLPAVLESNMLLWLRCHVPLCIAFESISVAGVRRGGGSSWAEALVIADGLRECFHLIRGLGYTLYPAGKSRLAHSPAWLLAVMLWMISRVKSFRELLASGSDECCALVDVLLAAAPQAFPPVRTDRIRRLAPATTG